jgi:Lon protease-like protein
MNEDQTALESFEGTTRLFPLPNLVFFPHVVQPLHVFEPRYRQLMQDTLASDRLMTLILLRPGWEGEYEGQPELHSVACLGRVVADQMLPDGRYNLLLRGLTRVRIVEEVVTDKLYRSARVEVLEDISTAALLSLMSLRAELEQRILPRFHPGPLRDQIRDLFHSELPLGPLTDILSFALPISVETKQQILEELEVEARAQLLLDGFQALGGKPTSTPAKPKKFPPDFSVN